MATQLEENEWLVGVMIKREQTKIKIQWGIYWARTAAAVSS
jgi:hypothetical protein